MLATDLKRTWTFVGYDVACDTGAGEVYLDQSPAQLSDLEACQKSCEAVPGCESISFSNSGSCSHFSTQCSKTKRSARTISMRRNAVPDSPSRPGPSPHTGRFALRWFGLWMACDVNYSGMHNMSITFVHIHMPAFKSQHLHSISSCAFASLSLSLNVWA